MKRILLKALIAGIPLFGWLGHAAPAAAAEELPERGARKPVLMVFGAGERHIDRVLDARVRVAAAGGQVRAIFGLAALYAEIEPGSAADLAKAPGVESLLDKKACCAPAGDFALESAYAAFNRILEGPKEQPGPDPVEKPAAEAPDLPRTEEERLAVEAAYKLYWDKERLLLPRELQRSGEIGCSVSSAGYYDTSLYLSGDVAVGVFYKNGTNPWTPGNIAATFGDIAAALDAFIAMEPTAKLTFVYSSEADAFGNPYPLPTNERTYANNLRNVWCTDWAYMISVQDGGVWPNAYLFGPSTRLDRSFGWFDYTVQHESGHIFGAGDQYGGASPASRYGYLQAAHGNACGNPGSGYFGGSGECQEDLMNGWVYNSKRGVFTAGQLGWHDNDGDGLLDLRETKPIVVPGSVSHTAANPPIYSGVVRDRPILNEANPMYGDVSVEKIAMVEFTVGNSPWQEAVPADGIWDSPQEGFSFQPPPLKNGTHTIKIRARNTAGAFTPVLYQENLVIAGSPVTNTRPFGTFKVTPERAMAGTTFTASAAGSIDFETPAASLSYAVKIGAGPWTPFAVSGALPALGVGTHVVQIRVSDGAAVHVIPRTVVVESYDTAPKVKMKVTPERRFNTGSTYAISVSLAGTTDAEGPFSGLMVYWDLDDDNVWEAVTVGTTTRTATLSAINWPKSDRRRVRVAVWDGWNLVIEERKIWIVPYDHKPTLPTFTGQITFTPAGPDVLATANAADADSATSWDGMLEYRWDFEGDGIWDTEYLPPSSILIPPAYQPTLAVEVKDRFHALVGWRPLVPVPPIPGPK